MTVSTYGRLEGATPAEEGTMRLEGIHHVTCITGNAPVNVEFYAGVLGLRLVKKTVNQDDPTVYHLFYADEEGSAGADITFFEYPGARRGRAGAGMVHTVSFRVASEDALAFWEERLVSAGAFPQRSPGRLRFEDPEGLGLELVVSNTTDRPLVAVHPEIPAEARDPGLRRRSGLRERSRAQPRAPRRRPPLRVRPVRRPGRSAAPSAVATSHTTHRPPPGRACPAPGRSTTSHGRRRWRITSTGSAS